MTDDKPIYHSPRRLPFTERDIVDKQIDEWIQNGVIEPCSSAYASQVLVVRKKDGSPRVCIDFRKLNRVLVMDHYPLPLIEDILDKLQDTRVFSTIDLRNGFFHVPVNKQSRPYTSFVTQNGQFQFLKMPFGLSTCPSTFQRFINTVFRDLVVQGIVLPYMDDIVILAKNESEAIERLKKVFQVSSDYGLEINFDKCQFLHRKIEFLGHIIENNKLFPSPSKTKSVVNYPEPKTTKEVQRFLGITGYFRKFIPAYSVIAKPLSDLLGKDTLFNFDVKQKASFDELKRLLCQKPVLGIYRQNCETEIHTDASIDGLAAVLLQRFPDDNSLHPIYYMSRKRPKRRENIPATNSKF
ncbi:retrovirus-related Pol polyprotein from transposon 297 [Trichonephila clavipes]|nr:retrovirus-related Pol polyprotein from transposon 297 [Trichonephila clavipes]